MSPDTVAPLLAALAVFCIGVALAAAVVVIVGLEGMRRPSRAGGVPEGYRPPPGGRRPPPPRSGSGLTPDAAVANEAMLERRMAAFETPSGRGSVR